MQHQVDINYLSVKTRIILKIPQLLIPCQQNVDPTFEIYFFKINLI